MKTGKDFPNRMWLLLRQIFAKNLFAISNVGTRNDGKDSLAWDRDENVIPIQVSMSHECAKFPFTLRNQTSDVPTFKQVFIHQEYNFDVKKQPDVVVDAGANIGLAAIYFASKYPNAKIIAIEPEESNFQLLQKNAVPYRNIIPVQAALWNENGRINLMDPGLGNWGFVTDKEKNREKLSGNYCYEVKSITVDKLIDDYGLNMIDLFKIDIEGAEKEIFSDSSAWIKKVNGLIIELHERTKPGCNRSFYNGSNGFDNEWQRGENVYLSRDQYLTKI